MMRLIGRGLLAYFPRGAELVKGRLRAMRSVEDVLRLRSSDLRGTVILTRDAGATSLTLIIDRVTAVVCTSGGLTSHLAVIAREFCVPCVMGAQLNHSGELDGLEVEIRPKDNIAELYVQEDRD